MNIFVLKDYQMQKIIYKNMKLLILAGGKGTRLKSEVPDVPKVLAPINGIPFVDFQIKNWLSQGITSLVFILHHEAEMIKNHIMNEHTKLLKRGLIHFVVEPYPLDTGGAISNAVRELSIKENFLVTNADTWLSSGFNLLSNAEAPALAITEVSDISRYGEVKVNKNKVLLFKEKNNMPKNGLINAGIFLFDPNHFQLIKDEIFSLEKDLLTLLVKMNLLNAVKLDTYFIDIGIPSDYNRFCEWIKKTKH